MGVPMSITVRLRGGIFTKSTEDIIRRHVNNEVLAKVEERTKRGGRGIGARRNIISHDHPEPLTLRVGSSRIFPRTRGRAWQRKNIGVVKAMAPRVARKAAERIVAEMGR